MDEVNPDGGGERVAHVIARAKERLDLTLALADIEHMEAMLAFPEPAMKRGAKLVRVKPHGHQVWSLPHAGHQVEVIFDPERGTIRTIAPDKDEDPNYRFKLGSIARIVRRE